MDDNQVRFVIQKPSHAINKTSYQRSPHATSHQTLKWANALLVLSPSFTASRTFCSRLPLLKGDSCQTLAP